MVWDDTCKLNENLMEVHLNSNEQRLPVQMSNLHETVLNQPTPRRQGIHLSQLSQLYGREFVYPQLPTEAREMIE